MQSWFNMTECATMQSQIVFECMTVQSWIMFEHVTAQSWIPLNMQLYTMFVQPNMYPFGTTECTTMNLT